MLTLIAHPTLGEHESESVADCTPSAGMSAVDQVTRAIGHAYDYESDEMGAAASVVKLTDSERVAYVLATAADYQRARDWEAETLASLRGSVPLPSPVLELETFPLPGQWSYVRSDDRGFWDAIHCATEGDARSLLADWVAENVPVATERWATS